MSRAAIVIFIGIVVVVLPILGIPSFWKTLLLSIAGLGLIFIGALMKREKTDTGQVPEAAPQEA